MSKWWPKIRWQCLAHSLPHTRILWSHTAHCAFEALCGVEVQDSNIRSEWRKIKIERWLVAVTVLKLSQLDVVQQGTESTERITKTTDYFFSHTPIDGISSRWLNLIFSYQHWRHPSFDCRQRNSVLLPRQKFNTYFMNGKFSKIIKHKVEIINLFVSWHFISTSIETGLIHTRENHIE